MGNARVFAMMMLLANQVTASANDGPLDISFGFLGQVELTPAGMAADALGTLRMRVDGQHRIVGCIRTVNGSNVTVPWLFRLTPSGGGDSGFAGTGSKFVAIPAGATGLACDGFDVAGDGRIVLASYDGSNQYIMRFKDDGSPDTTFNSTGTLTIARNGASNDFTSDLVIASDGSIYIAYQRFTANGARFLVRHILSTGTVDSGFGPGGGGVSLFDGFAIRTGVSARDDVPSRILLGTGGEIVLTGYTKPTLTGNLDFAAARLSSAGIPDSGFGTSGAAIVAFDLGQSNADLCTASVLDSQNRLVMAGYAQRATVGDADFAVVRLLPTGLPDPAFSGDGKVTIPFDLGGSGEDVATAVTLQTDGRILIGGYAKHLTGSSAYDWAVARLLDGGGLDSTFGAAANGKQTYSVNLGGNNNDFMYQLVANGSDFVFGGESNG
ncbi:MAG TPA: hypothetical protein VFI49_10445, partial [Rudaea sp.]|nr:hypothetical protein [Rudaea sp.]